MTPNTSFVLMQPWFNLSFNICVVATADALTVLKDTKMNIGTCNTVAETPLAAAKFLVREQHNSFLFLAVMRKRSDLERTILNQFY